MKRLYEYAILLMAFLLPGAYYGATWAVFAIVFICWLYAHDYSNIFKIIKQPQILLPVLFYWFIAAGILYAAHPFKALSALSTQISFILFPLIIGSSSIISNRLLVKVGQVFVLSICLFLSIAIVYTVFDMMKTGEYTVMINEAVYLKYQSFGLTRVFSNWHPTYVAMFVNLSVALQLQYCLEYFNKKNLLIASVIILFLTGCIILLNSLIGLTTFLVLVIYYTFEILKQFRVSHIMKIITLIVFFFCLLSLFYYNPLHIEKIDSLRKNEFKATDKQNERNLLTMRLAKWDTYATVYVNNWLVGVSSGDIKSVRKKVYEAKGYHDLARYNYNAHNQYLEVLATYGTIGGLIFLSMLFIPALYKKRYSMLVPFLIIVSLTFLSESVLVRQQGVLFFMFFYALYTWRKV